MRFKIFLCFLFLLSCTAQSVQAHVLKSDGSIGAVLHVSPEDDPIARQLTSFFFELKDKNGQFQPGNCDCKGDILQNGKIIYSAPLFQNNSSPSLDNASFSFTFPEKDIYQVQVSGKPTTTGTFQPFNLVWDVRVARESSDTNTAESSAIKHKGMTDWTGKHTPHLIGIFLILFFVLFYTLKQRK